MSGALRRRAGRHGLFWVAVTGFFLLLQVPAEWLGARRFYQLPEYFLVMLPAFLLATYPLLYGLLPRLLRGQAGLPWLLGLLGWAAGSAGLCALLRAGYVFGLAPGLLHAVPHAPFSWAGLLHRGMDFSFFALLFVAGGASAIRVYGSWHAQQLLGQQLQQRHLQAELQLLKTQLQPAFLFATLRTLHGLTQQQSPAAPGAVLQLAELLRYLLYASPLDVVPLADELAMLRHYVALEQLRLGPRLEVSLSFSVGPGRAAQPIAPLLLLPFVEQALHLGTDPRLDCPWVSIDLVAGANSLTFKVLNGQAGAGPTPPDPAHLTRARQRLAHLYPGRHELKIVSEPDTRLLVLVLRQQPVEYGGRSPLISSPTT